MKKFIMLFFTILLISSGVIAGSLSESIQNDIDILNEIVGAIKLAVERVDLVNTDSQMYTDLEEAINKIDLSISSMNTALESIPTNDFRSISKNEAHQFTPLSKEIWELLMPELQTIIFIANEVTDSLIAKTDYDTYLRILSPIVIDYQGSILRQNLENYSESLRRYEIVYGSSAPKLNFLETSIYLGILQHVSGFGPTEDGGPGSLELILSYSTAYVSIYDTDTEDIIPLNPVRSMFEIGLRKYLFREGWGSKEWKTKFLKPSYAALGLVVSGQQKGALTWPLSGKEKYGVFGAWGGIKLAYIFGDNGSFLLSKQLMTIPYLF